MTQQPVEEKDIIVVGMRTTSFSIKKELHLFPMMLGDKPDDLGYEVDTEFDSFINANKGYVAMINTLQNMYDNFMFNKISKSKLAQVNEPGVQPAYYLEPTDFLDKYDIPYVQTTGDDLASYININYEGKEITIADQPVKDLPYIKIYLRIKQ